jgi:ribonucleotide reductase alpha subunit
MLPISLILGSKRRRWSRRRERRIQAIRVLGQSMAIERLLTGSIQNQIQELMSTEDLVIEAFRDLVKDELKAHIRAKVDDDPDLKAEIKEAVAYYFHSKARSIYAELKATRAATRLGLRLLPDELQGEVGEALVTLFEKELGALLEKAL